MSKGYTQQEAKLLVGKVFVTTAPFSGVPMRTHGEVIEVYETGDHWNVVIQWALAGTIHKGWFSKDEMTSYMHVEAVTPG